MLFRFMPDVNSTLRTIAPWRYLIKTDLTQAFYQIPLSQSSLKYCGVATPFRGIRVYTRSAMGMPGSETALEEMMCRVLGDLIQEGCVTKLADDLYCGGDSPESLLSNWRRVLESPDRCNLCLSPTKTIICLKPTTILGCIWSARSPRTPVDLFQIHHNSKLEILSTSSQTRTSHETATSSSPQTPPGVS